MPRHRIKDETALEHVRNARQVLELAGSQPYDADIVAVARRVRWAAATLDELELVELGVDAAAIWAALVAAVDLIGEARDAALAREAIELELLEARIIARERWSA